MNKYIKTLLCPDTWCCAVRFNVGDNASILSDTEHPFKVIKDNYRYWTADPFIVFEENRYYLFFEAFDRAKRKGVLGYREINKDYVGEINIFYETDSHLSYPFIYIENGTYYIIPESYQQGELYRLRCISFPGKWEKEKVLLNDEVVDTSLIEHNGIKYYISQKVDEKKSYDRLDLFYETNGQLKPFVNNPVKTDASNARGAGAVFNYDGRFVRPSQDCGVDYGEKLNFNEIIKLDIDKYEERLIKTISHKDLKYDCKDVFTGIHTYNRAYRAEVIDLKVKGKVNILNTAGVVFKQLKRIIKKNA